MGYENCVNCGFICTILHCPPRELSLVCKMGCVAKYCFALYVKEGEVEQEVVGNCGGEMNVLMLLSICVYMRTVMYDM